MSRSRVGSASTNNMESRMLRDTVTRLEEELMYSQAEQKKLADQLNCLIMLVKHAWTGDKKAAVHVANIVGAAPPDIDHAFNGDIEVAVAAKPKSKALNNWTLLTVGILNREYRILEQEVASRQKQHLQMRQQFLEEQLLQQRDSQVRQEFRSRKVSGDGGDYMNGGGQTFMTQPAGRRGSAQAHRQMISAEERPASGKKKPAVRHLYRPATREAPPRDPVTVTDLFVGSAGNQGNNHQTNNTNKAMDGLYQLGPMDNGEAETGYGEYGEDPDRQDLHYADPQRYSMFGLFNSDMGPRAATKKARPPSGKNQRQTDVMRARPKSAAVGSGRPLKFETTRPVSNTRPVSGHPAVRAPVRLRAKSASAKFMQSSSSLQDHGSSARNTEFPPGDPRATSSHSHILNDLNIYDESEFQDAETDVRPPPQMRIEIKKPESVVRFEDDLLRMEKMEEDFRQTAVDLQRKLGISPNGIVY